MLNVRVKKALLTILTACLTVLMTIGAILGFTPTTQTAKAAIDATATGSFVKVTATPTDWSGDYLIVYEDGNNSCVLDGSRTNGTSDKLDSANNYKTVSISNNKIDGSADMKAISFSIEKVTDGYTIKSASQNYIGSNSTSNVLSASTSTKYVNTITLNGDGTAHIVGTKNSVLRFNSGDKRFRYYKSSSYSSQQAIHLYKWVENVSCNHVEGKYVTNNDGTHKVMCANEGCTYVFEGKQALDCALKTEYTKNGTDTHNYTTTCNICDYNKSETNVSCTYDNVKTEGATTTFTCACGNFYSTTKETYTVSYCVPDMEGISEIEPDTIVEDGTIVKLPTADAPAGYTFEGWVTKQAISATRPELFDITTKITEDMKLYALYKHEKSGVAKITDVSELKLGMTVVITNADATVALSTNQKSSNRGGVSIQNETAGEVVLNDDVQRLTLTAGTTAGTFAFKAGDSGYLYAASSSGNQLKTKTTLDVHGSWTIGFDKGVTSIVATGSSSRNVMQFNPNNGSPLFACYASASQEPLCLYAEGEATITYTTLQFGFANMTLKDELTMNYKVAMDDTYAGAEMTFTMADNTTTVTGTKVDGLYVYSLQVAPQYMGENITAVLKLGDTVLASKATYSVKEYAESLINDEKSTNEVKQLASDLLLYGAAAQAHTGHDTEHLVADLENLGAAPTTTDFSLVNAEVENGYPVYFTGANLNFSSLNTLYVTLSKYDEKVELYVNGEKVDLINNIYSTGTLQATQFNDTFTFVLKYDGIEMQTLTYSVNAYAYQFGQEGKEGTMADLARALYNYGKSVEAYVATLATQN